MEPATLSRRHTDLAAIGGRLGPEPEDFRVDELAAYEPCGAGPHWMIRVQKRLLTTPDLVRILARASGARERDIGVAGMKDRWAVTSQWVSVPVDGTPSPESWELPEGVEMLEVSRHRNKLRTGHLRGNRFDLRLVDTLVARTAQGGPALATWRERLAADGFANAYGPQRFGRAGSNLDAALAWLASEAAGAGGPRAGEGGDRSSARRGRPDRRRTKLWASVVQSEIFDRYLARRLALGARRVLTGEVVRLRGSGATFVVEDAAREQPRLEAGDLVLTGPMIGPKMRPATAEAARLEAEVTAELGLDEAALAALARHAPGTRRDLLAWPGDLEVHTGQADGEVQLAFSLEPGSYATVLLTELTGADPRPATPRVGASPTGRSS